MQLNKIAGATLLLLSLAYPLYLSQNWSKSSSNPLELCLPEEHNLTELPVVISANGTYLLRVLVTAGQDEKSTQRLLGWREYQTPKNFSHLSFQWVLIYQNKIIKQGNYADYSQYFAPFTSAPNEPHPIVGGEFAWIDSLKKGQYILKLTNLQMPAKLAAAHPRLQMVMHSSDYDFGGAYMHLFALSISLCVGTIGAVVLYRSRHQSRISAKTCRTE